MPHPPIIAAAGRDAQTVRDAGLPCLHLCTALTASGSFTVLRHPLCARGDLLGIVDQGGVPRTPSLLASSACSLAQSRGCMGVLADFQRPALSDAAAALDDECHRLGLSFWIPLELADCAPHGIYLFETAVSGGSLKEYCTELAERYGSDRIAAQLVRACSKFSIPSPTADGTPLTTQQANELMKAANAIPFFSRELCANYFTCTEDGQPRFILFDNAETLRAKQRLLDSIGISHQLLFYPDAAELGVLDT
ncbi:MAG: hypothetical protein ACI4PM_00795 [Butyricicoccus sp.]